MNGNAVLFYGSVQPPSPPTGLHLKAAKAAISGLALSLLNECEANIVSFSAAISACEKSMQWQQAGRHSCW